MISAIAHDVAGWIGAPTIVIVLALVAIRFYSIRRRVKGRRAKEGNGRGPLQDRSGDDASGQ